MLVSKRITIKQKPTTTSDHGRKVISETFENDFINGSIQPWDGELVKSLPEISRTKQKYVLFTSSFLNIYDSTQPHQVYINNQWFDILASEIWSEGIIHNCYVLAKLDE
jgi:hypothetical protein